MPHLLAPGTDVAGYRIESLLGEGATGSVHLARDADGRAVALKVLDPALAADSRFRERFLRESNIAALLEHPSVVPVLDAGEHEGLLYIAMEWVDGEDLRALLRREGALEPERAVALVEDVGAGLDVAHAAGLVHRDVKPANILVTGERARLCDFGLARHTASADSLTGDRTLVGTVAYIAPEQIEGAGVDARSDVYSLGCVLFECLTGEPPYDRDSELAVLYAHLNEPPPRPSARRPELPPAFDDVVAAALSKAPAERPASGGDLARAARAALHGEALRHRGGRRRLVALAAAGVIAGVTAAVVLVSGGADNAPARPSVAARAPCARRRGRAQRPPHQPGIAPGPARRGGVGRGVHVGVARRSTPRGQGRRSQPQGVGLGEAPVRRREHRGGRGRAVGDRGCRAAGRSGRRPQRARGADVPGRARSRARRAAGGRLAIAVARPRPGGAPRRPAVRARARARVDTGRGHDRARRRRRGLGRQRRGRPRRQDRSRDRATSSRATGSTASRRTSPSGAASPGSPSCPTTWSSS